MKKKAINMEMKQEFYRNNQLRYDQLQNDFIDTIKKMKSMIGDDSLKRLYELFIEHDYTDSGSRTFDQLIIDNDIDKDCFTLTLNDYKLKGKETIEKIGEFNHSSLD